MSIECNVLNLNSFLKVSTQSLKCFLSILILKDGGKSHGLCLKE